MGKYQFLAAIVVLITVEWIVFVCTAAFINIKYYSGLYFEGKTFEAITSTSNQKIPLWVLAFLRLVLFGWFGGFASIYRFSIASSGWHWYTQWNVFLLSVYYMLAFYASTLQLYKSYKCFNSVSRSEEYLARVLGSLYPVAGSAALMITVLNFILLSSQPSLWNITQHATTSISFLLLEMPLNNIPVNWQDVIWAVTWPMSYLFFIWPVVKLRAREWPYYFLEVENAGCFFWYNILFLASVIFFYIFFRIVKMKNALISAPAAQMVSDATVPIGELPMSDSRHQSV